MKITFILSQYNRISGGNRALFEYVNRLKKMGHSVRLFVVAKPLRWYRIDHWPRIFNKPMAEAWAESVSFFLLKVIFAQYPIHQDPHQPAWANKTRKTPCPNLTEAEIGSFKRRVPKYSEIAKREIQCVFRRRPWIRSWDLFRARFSGEGWVRIFDFTYFKQTKITPATIIAAPILMK